MKKERIDLHGQRIGAVTVVKLAGKTLYGNTLWRCRYDCGHTIKLNSQQLRRADVVKRSCRRCQTGPQKPLSADEMEAVANGIPAERFRDRMRRGYGVTRAKTEPVMTPAERVRNNLSYSVTLVGKGKRLDPKGKKPPDAVVPDSSGGFDVRDSDGVVEHFDRAELAMEKAKRLHVIRRRPFSVRRGSDGKLLATFGSMRTSDAA